MTEPEYFYVKGRGWIIARVFEYAGALYTYEFRAPKFGERYFRLPKTGNTSLDCLVGRILSTARGRDAEYIEMMKQFDCAVLTPLSP